jgi:trk system potassium uptake protein
LFLAQALEKDHPNVSPKMIEASKDRARTVAEHLDRTVVLHGDALDRDIIEEANVQSADTIVAVANDDEVNILASLLAKRAGCQRAITLINNATYGPLITSLGIDVVVNPRAITVSRILEHVRRGRIRSVHSLPDGLAEVIEAEALETSPLVGAPLNEIDLPHGMLVGAIARGDEVIIPRGETVIQAHDRIVMFTVADTVKKVEKMFAVRLEFF